MVGEMTAPERERAARLRAIRGYSGLKQDELARRLGISVTTLSRMENARTGAPTPTDLEKAAVICGVPVAFAQVGFAPLEIEITHTDRRVLELVARLADIEAWIAMQIEAGDVAAPTGELGRRLAALPPTPPDQLEPGSPVGRGARRGTER